MNRARTYLSVLVTGVFSTPGEGLIRAMNCTGEGLNAMGYREVERETTPSQIATD